MASSQGLLPPGVPDFSSVKDFVDEADARVYNENEEPSSPLDTDNLPPELRGLEERLQEMRKAPRKATDSAPKEKAEDEEDEPLKALYFVRVPKPDFDSPTYDLLQQDFEAQLAQVKIFAEHRRVQTLKKNDARTDTNKALACLKEANARVNEQRKKLDPYREQRAEDRKARAALKDSKRGLAASTERELDEIIRRLEFRMEHETFPLSEEKELHNEITRLKASRPRVREIEQRDAEFGAMTANRDLSPSNREHLEKELKEFRTEQSMYEKMYKDLRGIEREVDEELKNICSQLDIAAKKKDSIYEKLSAARQRRRMRRNEWQRNREFSRHIRSLVDEKRIEEAQEECMEQTSALMSMLVTNGEYRREYLALWSTKRNNPMAVFEDETSEKKKAVPKPAKKKSTLHANLQVSPGQSIPEAVVASTLKEANVSIQGKPVKKGTAVESSPPPQTQEPVPVKVDVKEKPPVKAVEPSVPTKPKKMIAHEDFELPAVIAEKTSADESAKEAADKITKEEASRAEHLEKQKLERIEAQKKKKAEQARKKKLKEEEHKEMQVKPKEPVVKAAPALSKKQPSQQKKQTVRTREANSLMKKMTPPAARPGKRKTKSEFEKITELLKQYPILVASSIAALCIAIIYVLL